VGFFESLPLEPEAVDVLGYDILDVACGRNYMIVLTTEHRLFGIGTNANGQLGVGEVESVEDWSEIKLPLRDGGKIVSVHSGHKNSFVVVENPMPKVEDPEPSPKKVVEKPIPKEEDPEVSLKQVLGYKLSPGRAAINKRIEEWMGTAHDDQWDQSIIRK
jgi:Regulator of chromosome condensation (RCC1) repeat